MGVNFAARAKVSREPEFQFFFPTRKNNDTKPWKSKQLLSAERQITEPRQRQRTTKKNNNNINGNGTTHASKPRRRVFPSVSMRAKKCAASSAPRPARHSEGVAQIHGTTVDGLRARRAKTMLDKIPSSNASKQGLRSGVVEKAD